MGECFSDVGDDAMSAIPAIFLIRAHQAITGWSRPSGLR
jgi:hypothetical protein